MSCCACTMKTAINVQFFIFGVVSYMSNCICKRVIPNPVPSGITLYYTSL
jgi:hypothetical protein